MPRMNDYRRLYRHYSRSRAWKRRRKRYYATHSANCAICDLPWFPTLHHISYANPGDEHDDDLVPLCSDHHNQLHHSLAEHTREATRDYIAKARAAHFDKLQRIKDHS